MGDVIEVDENGLHVLAAQCDTAAAALTVSTSAPVPRPPFQATAAAVRHGDALLEAAAGVLARRATATGAKLRTAATAYASTDVGSAEQISAVGWSVEV